MDIEQIFQQELTNYNNNYADISSLVLEFKDVYSNYLVLRDQFKSLITPGNFNQHDLAVLLQKHIDIVSHINDINKEMANIFSSFSSNSKEV
jgi:hypothetical protein